VRDRSVAADEETWRDKGSWGCPENDVWGCEGACLFV
jgi:hypothetical protein